MRLCLSVSSRKLSPNQTSSNCQDGLDNYLSIDIEILRRIQTLASNRFRKIIAAFHQVSSALCPKSVILPGQELSSFQKGHQPVHRSFLLFLRPVGINSVSIVLSMGRRHCDCWPVPSSPERCVQSVQCDSLTSHFSMRTVSEQPDAPVRRGVLQVVVHRACQPGQRHCPSELVTVRLLFSRYCSRR
jgi:hypothetical protein